MGYYCTVPQCTSLAGKTKNVKFHRFPRDEVMANKWNVILKRGKPYTKYSKVCSLHFTQADYNVSTMGQWKTLSKDAVPSQNLPKLNPDGTVMVIRKSRTVKYREPKKEPLDPSPLSEKIHSDKWQMSMANHGVPLTDCNLSNCPEQTNLPAYRLHSLNAIANTVSPVQCLKPKKQDAIMQTDPVASEDDDSQPNNSYSEVSERSYTSELETYQDFSKKYPKDDYIPQTNEEYNKEAEKYALERKSHVLEGYQKLPTDEYQKVDLYNYEKNYQRDYYQNGYQDSVELLRNQQHNIQMLQEQHRVAENQNFFNESHIKQEIDLNNEEEKFLYERSKEQLDANSQYTENQRRLHQQRLLDHIQQQVKREPETPNGCESIMQPQGSPYYPANEHNMAGGYFDQLPRPGPELLIAKQNALAAHTQLWQNTMKRPFFYSENPHYTGPQLLHRYEDLTRILQ